MTSRARWLTIAVSLTAGIAFALSVQGGQWWEIETADLGPFGARVCTGGECRSGALTGIGGDVQWLRLGMATWGAGLISLLVLVIMAAALAARRAPRLVAKMVLVSVATAALAGGAFIARFPTDVFPAAEVAHGVWLFATAIVLALAAAIAVLRVRA